MNPYDEVPYPVLSHSQTHPAALATLATLSGMRPPPVDRSRVLELGCASGGNLIPMALGLPDSKFVGVDYSARQIASGQSAIRALGLKNIRLEPANLLDLGADFGQFDYLIAHGVYSWVPPDVRDKVLEICKHNLSPNGVAYVSYNTYPGWKAYGGIRDMMLYHTRQVHEAGMRAMQARTLLEFLVQMTANMKNAAGQLVHAFADYLQTEMEKMRPAEDAYLLHDLLEAVNEPIYFHEFMAHAERHGLQFLGEIEFRRTLASNLPTELSQQVLQMAKNAVEWEQYLDFVLNRMFRQTLLCHAGVQLTHTLKPDMLTAFYVASAARAAGEVDIHSLAIQDFTGSDGATLSIDHPVTKAAMTYLAEVWPQAVPFETLLKQAHARLNAVPADVERAALDAQVLGANLLKAFTYSARLVELSVYAPVFAPTVSERPVASPWARLQAQAGHSVTNMRHERVDLEAFQRFLLRHLDGQYGRAALLDAFLSGPVASGDLVLKQDGQPVSEAGQIQGILAAEIEDHLRWLARMALLVA